MGGMMTLHVQRCQLCPNLQELAARQRRICVSQRWLEIAVAGSVISAGSSIAVLAVICQDLTVDSSATGTSDTLAPRLTMHYLAQEVLQI